MRILRDIVLDCGCDPFDWSADDRREACIELYRSDESAKCPTWMSDAVSEHVLAHAKEREAVLEALSHQSPAMMYSALGIIFARALLNYPLDELKRRAEEHEADWLAWRESA